MSAEKIGKPRREKGDGCIRKRSDGRWEGRYEYCDGSDGKKKVKYFYGKTKTDVKNKIKKYKDQNEYNGGSNILGSTVKEYMTEWLTNTKRLELKPTSYDRLENTCKHHIFPEIGMLQIGTLTPTDIQKLITKKSEQLSYSSVKKIYEAINAAFTLAVQRDLIAKSPVVGIALPKRMEKTRSDMYFFTEEQIKKIKHEVSKDYSQGKTGTYRLGAAYILLLNTGMRIGEALALEWDDVDFEKRTISITKDLAQIKNRDDGGKNYTYIVQHKPKTNDSIRIINMNDGAKEALEKLKVINGEYKYVLARANGKHTTHRAFDKPFRSIQKRCGISPQVGVHALRHTFASILFKNGIDVKTVSSILGHANTTITYNTYIHLINEQKVDAMKIIDRI